MRRFRLHAFGLIMYLVLALLKVALVNFTLNEYMMMMIMMMVLGPGRGSTGPSFALAFPFSFVATHDFLQR